MNTPVSFEIAKLLKEKGYENEDCESVYLGDFDEEYLPEKIELSTRNLRQRAIGEFDYIAPSIAEVVMWLYDNHKIWISVDPEIDTDTWFHTITHGKSMTAFGNYSGPIEAYEKGIEHILNDMI